MLEHDLGLSKKYIAAKINKAFVILQSFVFLDFGLICIYAHPQTLIAVTVNYLLMGGM